MEIWSKCDICGRDIPVGELCYGLKKGNCICKDCCTGFENCTFTLAPMPTLTPPNEPRIINADKLAKRIAGHSNYHGDSILSAIYCAAEGKENNAPIRPIENQPNEWVSAEDAVPDPGERVLATDGIFVGEAYRTSADSWHRHTGFPWRDGVTGRTVKYWMLLPVPPTKEE